MDSSSKPRIAWFSPLLCDGASGAQTVSAHCTDLLVDALSKHYELELFHDGEGEYRGYPAFHYLQAVQRHKDDPFNLFFYQLEDRPESRFCRLHMEMAPGVVWFHDLYFNDPLPLVPGSIDRARMQTGILYTTDDLLHLEVDPDSPLGVREIGMAALKLFSSERSTDFYRQQRRQLVAKTDLGDSAARDSFVPFPAQLPPEWNRSEEQKIVAFCGSLRSEHRAHKLCEALAGMDTRVKLVWCVDADDREDAERLVTKYNVRSYELIENRSIETWTNVLSSASAAVHILFSAYGDPGPHLAVSLLAGVPVLVTNFGYGEYLPDKVVVKIDPGEGEMQSIADAVATLVNNGEAAKEFSAAAAAFAAEHHSVDVVAEELHCALEAHREYLASIMEKWKRYVIHKSSSHPSLQTIPGIN